MEKYFKTLDDKFKDSSLESSLNHGVELAGKNVQDLYVLTERLNQDIENQQIKFTDNKKEMVSKQKNKLNYLAEICEEAELPLTESFKMLELLKGTKPSVQQKEYIRVLNESLDEVDEKLKQAYDYSKLEVGEFMPEFVDFNLTNMLVDIFEHYQIKAFGKGIDLNLIIEEKLWDSYKSDPLRVGQLLNGILSNAIEFTDNGSIDFIVEQAKHFGTMSEIKFIVRDTGNGVKMDKMSKIFQQVKLKYSNTIANREKEMAKSNFNVVSKIAQYMGGELKIESSGYQGGVQFALILPFEISSVQTY